MNKSSEELLFEVGLIDGKIIQIRAESYSIINIIDVGFKYVFTEKSGNQQCNYCINDLNYPNFNAMFDLNIISYIIRID